MIGSLNKPKGKKNLVSEKVVVKEVEFSQGTKSCFSSLHSLLFAVLQ